MTDAPRGRLEEALAARRDKLERLRARGEDPFALRFDAPTPVSEVRRRFDGIDAGAQTGERERVAGRIVLLRRHGRLSFATLRDRDADLQLFLSEDVLGDRYALLDDLDLGDIVGAEGEVVKTKRGELSVRPDHLVLLTKALRPMPEKWHGLADTEARYRKRYLDLASNLETRRVVAARAKVLAAIRRELDARGFLEVETPVLQVTHGGALARPFVTRHRVLDMDMYLRIAPELYLKRLLVGGLERVYEIGRNFRNEGIDRDHNPEFTMLEVYQAYADYLESMELVEVLVKEAALAVRGSLRFGFQGQEMDLERPWRRARLDELVSEAVGSTVSIDDEPRLRRVAADHGVTPEGTPPPGALLAELYEKLVEPNLFQPTWVMDLPQDVSPLARPHRSTPGFTEHADLVIAGTEMAPVYSELTDPDEQRARFEAQRTAKAAGDEEAHPYDADFVEALEHGMPPAGGFGLGIDRLLIVLTDLPSLRDVIVFPHLRPQPGT